MIDIISQHSNTLPSGLTINFTVGRIVKDNSEIGSIRAAKAPACGGWPLVAEHEADQSSASNSDSSSGAAGCATDTPATSLLHVAGDNSQVPA